MLKSKRFNTAATIILTVLVIITLLPLALIVISSFTKESALIRNGYSFWPQEWSLDAYYYRAVVAVSGGSGVGKSTTARLIHEYLEAQGIGLSLIHI